MKTIERKMQDTAEMFRTGENVIYDIMDICRYYVELMRITGFSFPSYDRRIEEGTPFRLLNIKISQIQVNELQD